MKTLEEAEKIIKRYELREVARFASWKSDNAFAKDNGKARSRPTPGWPISVQLRYCEIELGYSIFPCDVIKKNFNGNHQLMVEPERARQNKIFLH